MGNRWGKGKGDGKEKGGGGQYTSNLGPGWTGRRGVGLLQMPLVLLICLLVIPVEGFTAFDCSNRSNIVKSYSLLEPDACANMGRDGEVETTVYGG
jgi:hypothetical protein